MASKPIDSTVIPEWAKKRACELANAEHNMALPYYAFNIGRDGWGALTALAKHIAEHEQPPVDPLTGCVRAMWRPCGDPDEFASLLQQQLDIRNLEIREIAP